MIRRIKLMFGLKKGLDAGLVTGPRIWPIHREPCGRRSRPGSNASIHGQSFDQPTVTLMAEKGVWWSLQPFTDDQPSAFVEGSPNRLKQLEKFSGTDNAYMLAKKFRIKTA